MTVKLDQSGFSQDHKCKFLFLKFALDYSGSVVSAAEPMERLSLYWGYRVRVASKFEDIFEECPYKCIARPSDNYDLKLAISNDKTA